MKFWIKAVSLFVSVFAASATMTYFLQPQSSPEEGNHGQVISSEPESDLDLFTANLASTRYLEATYTLKGLSTGVGFLVQGDTFNFSMASLDNIFLSTTGKFVLGGLLSIPYTVTYQDNDLYAAIEVGKWKIDNSLLKNVVSFFKTLGFAPNLSLPEGLSSMLMGTLTSALAGMQSTVGKTSIDYALTSLPFISLVFHSDLDHNFTGLSIPSFSVGNLDVSFDLNISKVSSSIPEQVQSLRVNTEEFKALGNNLGLLGMLTDLPYSDYSSQNGFDFDISAKKKGDINGDVISGSLLLGNGASSSRLMADLSIQDHLGYSHEIDFDGTFGSTSEYYAAYQNLSLGEGGMEPLYLKGKVESQSEGETNANLGLNEAANAISAILSQEHTGASAYLFSSISKLGYGDILPAIVNMLTNNTLSLAMEWKIFSFLGTSPIQGINLGLGTISLDLNNNIFGLGDGCFNLLISFNSDGRLKFSLSNLSFGGFDFNVTLLRKSGETKFVDLQTLSLDPTYSESFLDINSITNGVNSLSKTNIGLDFSVDVNASIDGQHRDETSEDSTFSKEEIVSTMSGSLEANWENGLSLYLGGGLKDRLGVSHEINAYLEGQRFEEADLLLQYHNDIASFGHDLYVTDNIASLSALFSDIQLVSGTAYQDLPIYKNLFSSIVDRIDELKLLFTATPEEFDIVKILTDGWIKNISYGSGEINLVLDSCFLHTVSDVTLTLTLNNGLPSKASLKGLSFASSTSEDAFSIDVSLSMHSFDASKKIVKAEDDNRYLDLKYFDLETLIGQKEFSMDVRGSFTDSNDLDHGSKTIVGSLDMSLSKMLGYGSFSLIGQEETNAGSGTFLDTSHNFTFDYRSDEQILFSYMESIAGNDKGSMLGRTTKASFSELGETMKSLATDKGNARFMQYFNLLFTDGVPAINSLMPMINKIIQNAAVVSDCRDLIKALLNTGGIPLVRDLDLKDNIISLTISKELLSTVEDIKIEVVLDKGDATHPFFVKGLNILNLSMGSISGSLSLTNKNVGLNYVYDDTKHPLRQDASAFTDYSSFSKLMGHFMKTAGYNSFHLNGTLDLTMKGLGIDLGGLADTKGITIDAYIWIDEEEKVYAKVRLGNVPTVYLVNSIVYGGVNCAAQGTKTIEMFYDSEGKDVLGGDVYMHEWEGFWYFGNRVKDKYSKQTASDFASNILPNLLKFCLNFHDSIYNLINNTIEKHEGRTEPMAYSELLTSMVYTRDGNVNQWDLGLNFPLLANNSQCRSLSISLFGEDNSYFNRLKVFMHINTDADDGTSGFICDLSVDGSITEIGTYEDAKTSTAFSDWTAYMAAHRGDAYGETSSVKKA